MFGGVFLEAPACHGSFVLLGVLFGLAAVVMLFDRVGPQSGIDVPLTRMAMIAVFLILFGIQSRYSEHFYVSFLDVGKTLK